MTGKGRSQPASVIAAGVTPLPGLLERQWSALRLVSFRRSTLQWRLWRGVHPTFVIMSRTERSEGSQFLHKIEILHFAIATLLFQSR